MRTPKTGRADWLRGLHVGRTVTVEATDAAAEANRYRTSAAKIGVRVRVWTDGDVLWIHRLKGAGRR